MNKISPDFSICKKCNRFYEYNSSNIMTNKDEETYVCQKEYRHDWILAEFIGGKQNKNVIPNIPKDCCFQLEHLFKMQEIQNGTKN